ncbi:MAG: hypothetical protein LUE17_12100 [Planctomycetaceae bacterium]|nr:hypothetical protein [Planctomycetaceae bacterium]
MTTTAKKKTKQLRIREELLPETAKYATFDGTEYVMIPVADFGDWYEDVEDGAIVRYAHDNPSPIIPAEEVHSSLRSRRKGSKR